MDTCMWNEKELCFYVAVLTMLIYLKKMARFTCISKYMECVICKVLITI